MHFCIGHTQPHHQQLRSNTCERATWHNSSVQLASTGLCSKHDWRVSTRFALFRVYRWPDRRSIRGSGRRLCPVCANQTLASHSVEGCNECNCKRNLIALQFWKRASLLVCLSASSARSVVCSWTKASFLVLFVLHVNAGLGRRRSYSTRLPTRASLEPSVPTLVTGECC